MTAKERIKAGTLERIDDLNTLIGDNEKDIVRYNNNISRCKEENVSYAEEIGMLNKLLATLDEIE